MSAPTFSVVIPAYQAAGTIAEAVESALGQTLPPHEVIVCDDGSTDDLARALAPYRARISLIRKENGGGASALNAATAAATGEFVVVLDADDAYLPGRLEALSRLAAERPDLDILSTDAVLEADGRPVGTFYAGTPFAADHQRIAILERCFLFAPALRRARLHAIGGFDESLRIAYDWDCWLRSILAGARAGTTAEALVRYRLHEGSLASNRPAALRERAVLLEKARASGQLTHDERRVLERVLASSHRQALLAEGESALRGRLSRPRRRLLAIALGRGFSPGTRAKALAAVLVPRVARGRLEHREQRSGRSRLARPVSGE